MSFIVSLAALSIAVLAIRVEAVECGVSDAEIREVVRDEITLPEAGQSYVDPAFGCSITRLTDNTREGFGTSHPYSSVNPFNADNSLILLVRSDGTVHLRDLHGTVVRDRLNDLSLTPQSDPLWSRSDPNILYFHPEGGNEIRQYDASTHEVATLHTFEEYRSITFGNGEGDVSDTRIPILADGRYGLFFDLSSQTASPAADLLSVVPSVDNVDLAGPYFLVMQGDSPGGVAIFDAATMTPVGKATEYAGHSDRASWRGQPTLVITNNVVSHEGCRGGIVKVAIPSGEQHCLASLGESLGVHISCNNAEQGWCVVTTYMYEGYWVNWIGQVVPTEPTRLSYKNEILKLDLDTGQITRLAHTRSTNQTYGAQPKAAVSADGSLVVFTSDMLTPGNTDVFLIRLSETPEPQPIFDESEPRIRGRLVPRGMHPLDPIHPNPIAFPEHSLIQLPLPLPVPLLPETEPGGLVPYPEPEILLREDFKWSQPEY